MPSATIKTELLQGATGCSRPLFLIGMPGAGKTFWGREVATAFNLPFTDLDEYIAGKEGASINAIFATYGEQGFREREHKYLGEIVGRSQGCMIIACGGGTPCFQDNMEMMLKAGTVVYLKAPIALLLEHISADAAVRPLLRGKQHSAEYLDDLLRKRSRYYERANIILTPNLLSIATFEEIVK